ATADGVFQQLSDAARIFRFCERLPRINLWFVPNIPILLDFKLSVTHHDIVAWQQLLDIAVNRLRGHGMAEGQVVHKTSGTERPGNLGHSEKCLNLGSKHELLCVVIIIERFFTYSVSCKNQALCAAIPDRKCEHAVKSLEAVHSPFLVGVQNHFRITMRAKLVSLRFQLWPQVKEVVNFAIEDDADSFIFAPDRLLPISQVDNAETAGSKTDMIAIPGIRFVRPAVLYARERTTQTVRNNILRLAR